jgi:hypothetical protein
MSNGEFPGYQHGEHTITACNRILDDLGVIRHTWNDGDAASERIKLVDALLSAHTDHLIAAIQGVLHHVLPKLPGSPHNTNSLHSVPRFKPIGFSIRTGCRDGR